MSEAEWLNIFSDNLSNMLKKAGFTQSELSEETGLSASAISNYINGRKTPTIKAIINIAYVLDCSISDLVDFGDIIR